MLHVGGFKSCGQYWMYGSDVTTEEHGEQWKMIGNKERKGKWKEKGGEKGKKEGKEK